MVNGSYARARSVISFPFRWFIISYFAKAFFTLSLNFTNVRHSNDTMTQELMCWLRVLCMSSRAPTCRRRIRAAQRENPSFFSSYVIQMQNWNDDDTNSIYTLNFIHPLKRNMKSDSTEKLCRKMESQISRRWATHSPEKKKWKKQVNQNVSMHLNQISWCHVVVQYFVLLLNVQSCSLVT